MCKMDLAGKETDFIYPDICLRSCGPKYLNFQTLMNIHLSSWHL